MNESEINVLVVEDDEGDYILTESYLKQCPHQHFCIRWAKSYEEALEAARTRFDVCLLDYELGGRDGVEVAKQLASRGCQAPIVMLTGIRRRDVDLQAMQAGATEYLVKDQVNAETLERTIRYAIERAALLKLVRQHEARLEHEAIYDEVSGAYNRRHFMTLLADAHRAAVEEKQPLVAAMIEVNDIRRLNEIFGHRAGDDAIHALGEMVVDAMEPGEVCGRYCGPQFCAYFPRKDVETVRALFREIQEKLQSKVFKTLDGYPFAVKASYAVVEVPENDATMYDVLDSIGLALVSSEAQRPEEEMRFVRVDALLARGETERELKRAA